MNFTDIYFRVPRSKVRAMICVSAGFSLAMIAGGVYLWMNSDDKKELKVLSGVMVAMGGMNAALTCLFAPKKSSQEAVSVTSLDEPELYNNVNDTTRLLRS